MQWLQIVLLILKLLRQAKSATSAEQFVQSVQAEQGPMAANGEFLRWLWENRQEIIDFIMSFFATSDTFRAPPVPGAESAVRDDEAEVLALLEELKG